MTIRRLDDTPGKRRYILKMQSRTIRIALAIAFATVAAGLAAQDSGELLRKNTGLILDTPFLHQDDHPYESEYSGPYGDELVVYEYNEAGMPIFVRYEDLSTGTPYLDVEVAFRPDGQIRSLTYLSYDEAGEEVIYIDRFDFSSYTPFGPRLGTMIGSEGTAVEMRLTYDEVGRLVGLEEDDASGAGYFRIERYAWASFRGESLPYAIDVRYPLDGEVERYRYLYDARNRLAGLDGFNALVENPEEATPSEEWYFYRSGTFDEIFGRIEPLGSPSSTAAR